MKKIIVFDIFALLFIVFSAYGGPVPDTQQIKCYNDSIQLTNCPQPGETFFGQDAQYNTTAPSYTKLGTWGQKLASSSASWIMIQDNVTGLTWEVKNSKDGAIDYSNLQDADNTYSWYDSNPSSNGGEAGTPENNTDTEDFINNLNAEKLGGFSDWRMPTARELSFIINRAAKNRQTNNTSYFPNTAIGQYWTSTTDPTTDHSERAASVDYSTGWMNFPDKLEHAHVRAVRGEKLSHDFTDNGDGTVTDKNTGLMWQQDSSSDITWGDALSYCENHTLAGYNDWRMPNINELQSLVDYDLYNSAVDKRYFPVTSLHYWSSTTCAYSTDKAFHVCFLRGRVETSNKLDLNVSNIRAVRGDMNGEDSEDNGKTCPAAFLLGDKDPEVNKIRKFRDVILTKTLIGQKLIALYNRNSERITDVLQQNPMMQKFAKKTLKILIPVIDFL